MNKTTLSFNASEQLLTSAECPKKVASNTVSYIEAVFELGANWSGFDSVRAVWSTRLEKISTVLDSNGKCIVPHELLANTQKVSVNLVGSIVEDDVLTDRLTTYPIVALDVDADALVEGTETTEVTPSQFEQFVEQVIAEVEKVTGMTATAVALPSGSAPTATYEDGVLTLGIPRGEKGDTGDTGPQGDKGDKGDTGAKGDTGEQGETGNGIVTVAKTSTSGLVDTYTITFTDGTSTTFEVTNGQNGEVTYDELSELLPTETASGDIASFNDGQAVIPALSVVATITPIQSGSGTPSPSNVRPISGHDEVGVGVVGVNQWDEEWRNGFYYVDTGAFVANASRVANKNPIKVKPNTTYFLNKWDKLFQILYLDADGNYTGLWGTTFSGSFTTPSNCYYINFCTQASSTYGATYNNDISINYPSTEHNYHAYNGQTYTDALPTTVYGGTLDLVSGVLTVDRGSVDMGTLNWIRYQTTNVFYAEPSNTKLQFHGITPKYPEATWDSVSSAVDKTWSSQAGAGHAIWLCDSAYSDATSLKTALNGAYLVYELATPTTYQLTPQQIDTLKGQNNITATSGQVSVTYKADIQKYIDNAIATFA